MREERKRRAKNFLPRSTEFRWSKFIGPRTKVIASKRATLGYRKHEISPRIKTRSSGNQRFLVLEVSTRLPRVPSMLQEVGNSFYLDLFFIFGLEMVGCSNSYRASFA